MFVGIVVVFVAALAAAQEHALSTAPPSNPHPFPFLDLFTGSSNYYPDIRKTYTDSGYYTSCPKADTLASFASILSSAAKIMLSAAIIMLVKLLGGKLLLLPIIVMFIAKLGLKALLLWPLISKLIKYFKKKRKKGLKSRIITDCSQRFACVIQKSSQAGWMSNIGAAVAFSFIDDVEEESLFAKSILSALAGDKVAESSSSNQLPEPKDAASISQEPSTKISFQSADLTSLLKPITIKATSTSNGLMDLVTTFLTSTSTGNLEMKGFKDLVINGIIKPLLIAKGGIKTLISKLTIPLISLLLINLEVLVTVWWLWEDCPQPKPQQPTYAYPNQSYNSYNTSYR
ncbi:unnamed protein product, partial [Iphiclides podalirius]